MSEIICTHNGDFNAVLNGKYYKDFCSHCLALVRDGSSSPSSGHASFNRQQDLIDHEADVQQPYTGGQPNEKFIQAYPKKSREIFSAEQIRNASR